MNVRTPECPRRAGRYIYQVYQLVVEFVIGHIVGVDQFGDFILPVFQPLLVFDELVLADFIIDPHIHQLLNFVFDFRMLLFQGSGMFLVMYLFTVVG